MKIQPRIDTINELLIRKGLTKRGLANIAEIGHATVIQICNGNRQPSPPVAKKIVDALEVDFDEIFLIAKEVEEHV